MADLKNALEKCLVNFDRRVFVTDLINKYDLTYEVANKTLELYITEQEKQGLKYEKRFLVHGAKKNDTNEVYTVAEGEAELEKWKKVLKNAEISLYSVEIAGGAKAPAQDFKPMQRCEVKIKDLKGRVNNIKLANGTTTNAITPVTSVAAKKIDIKKESTEIRKTPPEKNKKPELKKISPEEKKATQKNANKKGGINNFFTTKATDRKNAPPVKTASPAKKPSDFFKPQPGKSPKKEIKEEANKSVQIFDSESEELSDEEEKLNALKRDIIYSDHDDEPTASCSTNFKRRRIEDSDEEDVNGQTQNHEKNAKTEEIKSPMKSETILDEDGFIITVKKSNINTKAEKPEEKQISTVKKALKMPSKPLVAKTKQGNIMNFFKKK